MNFIHVCADMVLFTDMGCFFLSVEYVEQILCLIRYFWDWQNYRYWKSSNCATLFLFIQDWCSILASPKWTEKFPIIGTSKCSVSFAIDMLSKNHDHSTFFPSLLGVLWINLHFCLFRSHSNSTCTVEFDEADNCNHYDETEVSNCTF